MTQEPNESRRLGRTEPLDEVTSVFVPAPDSTERPSRRWPWIGLGVLATLAMVAVGVIVAWPRVNLQRLDPVERVADAYLQALVHNDTESARRLGTVEEPPGISSVRTIQRPDVIVVLTESQRTFRLIYLDGRGHPEDVNDYPEWMGSSMGHWEGATLVVDTVAIKDRTWLDTSGHEHSDQLKMAERYRLLDRNTLEMVVTYDDPVFFVKPFTTRRLAKRQIGDRIMDHSCLENEKDIINLVPTIGDAGR